MGTKELNQKLQEELNPYNPELAEKNYGDVIFREGDRIMQIKNNYEKYKRQNLLLGIILME